MLTPLTSQQYEELCRFFVADQLKIPIESVVSRDITNPWRVGTSGHVLGESYVHQIDLYWETEDGMARYINIANAKWRSGRSRGQGRGNRPLHSETRLQHRQDVPGPRARLTFKDYQQNRTKTASCGKASTHPCPRLSAPPPRPDRQHSPPPATPSPIPPSQHRCHHPLSPHKAARGSQARTAARAAPHSPTKPVTTPARDSSRNEPSATPRR
jgi:hypothetical protein